MKWYIAGIVVLLSIAKGMTYADPNLDADLYRASEEGRIEDMNDLIAAGADVDAYSSNGRTPLMAASIKEHTKAVSFLIDSGADFSKTTPTGDSVLWFARTSEIAGILVDAGVNPNGRFHSQSESYPVFFWYVCNQSSAPITKIIIEAGADVNTKASNGETALIYMVKRIVTESNLAPAKILINAGINVDAKDINGMTALLHACGESRSRGYVNHEFIQMLIDAGADVNIKTKDGQTPFSLATKNGHVEVVNILLKSGAVGVKSVAIQLLEAVKSNNLDEVRNLLAAGVDVNLAIDEKGTNALLIAVAYGYTDMFTYLLSVGGDINATDEQGKTPLILAAEKGYVQVVRQLLDKGADVNTRTYWNYTALAGAASNNHTTNVNTLLEAGAIVDVASSETCYTPLLRAVVSGSIDCSEILLKWGANPNAADKTGQTALFWACYQGHPQIVRQLIAAGADLNALSRSDATPLMTAASKGLYETVELLLSLGVNIHAKDASGTTALDRASAASIRAIIASRIMIQSELREAIEAGNRIIVEEIIAEGGFANCVFKDGRTPLIVALSMKQNDIARELIELGADTNMPDSNGLLPISYATKNRNEEIMPFLIEKGASIPIESGRINFGRIDENVKRTPENVETDLDSLVSYLIDDAKNEWEKVRAIFMWIATNIKYDWSMYFKLSYGVLEPSSVLQSRKSVCEGFSLLFKAMCELAGLPSRVISGYTYQGLEGHAWNLVRIYGRWHLFDTTWASSDSTEIGSVAIHWFNTPPEIFIKSHYPLSSSRWQLLADPISLDKFVREYMKP